MRLTFSTVIFDHESLGHGLTYPSTLIAPRNNPSPEPELPASNPTRVVGQLDLSDHCLQLLHGDTYISGKKRPLSRPLSHDATFKVLARPVGSISGREIPIEDDNLNFDRTREILITDKVDLERVCVGIHDFAPGEDG